METIKRCSGPFKNFIKSMSRSEFSTTVIGSREMLKELDEGPVHGIRDRPFLLVLPRGFSH
jgi:hypothetical protein